MQGNDAIVAAALSFVGTPYHHQGRAPGFGLDCAGVVECAYRAAGFDVPVHNGYERTPHNGFLETTLQRYFRQANEAANGDVMLIAYFGVAHHLAIYHDGRMVHASVYTKKCVDHRIDAVWKRKTIGFFRWHKH